MKGIKKIACICLCFLLAVNLFAPQEIQAKTNLKKQVTVSYRKTPTGILAIYKNKNKKAVRVKATMHFKDGGKKDISRETQENLCLGGKSTATFFFPAPRDENGDCINYTSYSSSYSVSKSKFKNYASKIKISHQLDPAEAKFVAVNTGNKGLSHIHATLVFYNGDGVIARCFTKELNCYHANDIQQFSIQYPDDMRDPSSVKVYVDWAY